MSAQIIELRARKDDGTYGPGRKITLEKVEGEHIVIDLGEDPKSPRVWLERGESGWVLYVHPNGDNEGLVTIGVEDGAGKASVTVDDRECQNYYKCSSCGVKWKDRWTSACEDECPVCGSRHITPYLSSVKTDEDQGAEAHAARQKAVDLYGSSDVEIDDDAKISVASDETWVQAWVRVPN